MPHPGDSPVTHTAEAANDHQLEAASYNEFVDYVELSEIELVKVAGERLNPGAATRTRFEVAVGYSQDGPVLRFRYDAVAYLIDATDSELGHVSSSVVITLHAPTDAQVAHIQHFGATSAALMAHPYLREALASIAQRLGFHGVLVPMIKYQPHASLP